MLLTAVTKDEAYIKPIRPKTQTLCCRSRHFTLAEGEPVVAELQVRESGLRPVVAWGWVFVLLNLFGQLLFSSVRKRSLKIDVVFPLFFPDTDA